MRLQDQIVHEMIDASSGGRDAVRGLINPQQGFGPQILNFLHPVGGVAAAPVWHRAVLRAWTAGARVADRVLA
jgi:hypothetical protein